ncbi:MAG: response regulator [Anaerolineae bacterium]
MTKRILLIEDNPNNALLIQRILEPTPFQLSHAWDGESGLRMVMEQHPDLILLDLGLPDVDGQTIASFIRRIPELESVPMIAVTAWPEETAREMVRAYGCDAYVSKPLDAKSFLAIVQSYLAPPANTAGHVSE